MTFSNGNGSSFDTLAELMDDYSRNRPWHQKVTDCFWLPFCWYVRNPYRSASLAVRHAWQRVFRGWDDRALWSLDDHLSKALGEQLVKMAEIAHGYPGDEEYPADMEEVSFRKWTDDLRCHGEALLAYNAQNHDLHGDEWEAMYAPAQEALRWVADHFATLWD